MNTSQPPILQVAAKAAVVNAEGQILLLREARSRDATQTGKWGLPGGRLDPGERFLDGLQREVLEETGLRIIAGRPLYVGEWNPVIRGAEHQIIAIFMLCRLEEGQTVQLSDEHDEYAWISPAERHGYTFMKPDDLVIDAAGAQLSS